ncbi:MAG: TonB-dependent receptor, partial [Woeseiaceae bacterium]
MAAAVTAALYPGQALLAQETEAGSSRALEEIVVTARKRAESAQDIPIAIQALSQESLEAMGARSMEDYARFIPSINVVTYSNSSSTIVFRGAITGAGYIAQSTSSVYLDEMSITSTGSQPSIRAVDIQRVEALSGPQGTLYGSDAQAGTLRIVTNKPDPTRFEAIFDGELRGGEHSDPSYRGSLVFNVPLVEDQLALRVVGFSDRDGGFIDNVFGHTPDTAVLQGPGFYPPGFGTLDNSQVVEDRWNESDTHGGRLSLLWNMNDRWTAMLTGMTQTVKAGADNYYDPFVGDLQTVRFHDEWTEDQFDMYSLVFEGDLGFAQLVSATSYYERDIKYLSDITAYAHYWAAQYCHDSYYMPGQTIQVYYNGTYVDYTFSTDLWANPDTGYIVWWPVYCQGTTVEGDYFAAYYGPAQQDKFTQEIRLSHEGDTLDWIVGLYYEDSSDAWQAPFATPTTGGDGTNLTYQDSISLQYWEHYWSLYYGTPVTYPNASSHWASGSHTDWEQKAVFGEATWHISDQLDLTVGGRYFERENTNYYYVDHPGRLATARDDPGVDGEPDTTAGDRDYRLAHNGLPEGRTGTDEEVIPKVSLSFSLSDDALMYGLYTRGKRPGGVNRSRGQPFFPSQYDADLMDNYELGYKSSFARGQGRFNTTIYHMLWSDYQLELVDPASTLCIDPNTGDP